ncbi:MAG TPA: YhdH/YhfP family quinone oxidoreductase [Flavitalea sp.]|nr:YhdH/YhfP family quinone oxidoreductase [Flavitalea sp.]
MRFKSLVVTEKPGKIFERKIIHRETDDLPAGEVLIRVHYSSLNYKDALSATGNKGITRNFPHTPGIDAAGIVEQSSNGLFRSGDEVVITGYDLGMNTSGGFGQYIRVPASWIIKKPLSLSLKQCMIIGTAGFTAATAVYKMQLLGVSPCQLPIVVSGATGGVGSFAVAILTKAGYTVTAITGKKNATEYLEFLGASQIKERDFLHDQSGKPLIKSQWAGGIDTVGGRTLETMLKGCAIEGGIVSTGLVDSPLLSLTVYPFILNGVSLLGVGSAGMSMPQRLKIWDRLAGEWNVQSKLGEIGKEVTLEEVNDHYIDEILQGKIKGRILVSLL